MHVQRTKTLARTLAVTLLAALTFMVPDAGAQATDAQITIEAQIIGDAAPEDLRFTLTPWLDGCAHGGEVTVPGSGGTTTIDIAQNSNKLVEGPFVFTSADFTSTPLFSNVTTFDFSIGQGLSSVTAGELYTDTGLGRVQYSVSGQLNATPSGFPAFNLVRDIAPGEFYDQGSHFTFQIDAAADLADGLQLSEFSVFEFDAREVDTGRYHPPTLVLRNDGTGGIANSNNMGGVNPATMQVVDVEMGDEYITDLAFDAAAITVADPRECSYRVNALPVPGYSINRITGSAIGAGEVARFEFIQEAATTCANDLVTIDMNTNGGIGIGTDGDDVVLGTPGDDVIDTGLGNDVICAGDGNDIVLAGAGEDRVFGEAGNDKLFGGAGDDNIRGSDGDDVIHGNGGADRLGGGDGNDRIFGYADNDVINGGPGDDKLHGNFGDDFITGGMGNDFVFGYGDNDRLSGGPDNDVLRGNFGDDILSGGGGDDVLIGSAGADTVEGNSGADDVQGNSGDDILTGGMGDDLLDGGIGTDTCQGDDGVDTAMRCETETTIE